MITLKLDYLEILDVQSCITLNALLVKAELNRFKYSCVPNMRLTQPIFQNFLSGMISLKMQGLEIFNLEILDTYSI